MANQHAGDDDENEAAGELADTTLKAGDTAKTGKETNTTEAADDSAPPTPSTVDLIDAGVRIEIDLVTLAVVRRIAEAIAGRVAKCLTRNGATELLVMPPAMAGAIGPARMLVAELRALAKAIEGPGPSAEGEEAIELPGFVAAAAIKGALAKVPAAFDAIASAIQKLPVEEQNSGRTVTIDERTLATVIAGRLVEWQLRPLLIGCDLPFDTPTLGLVERVVRAAAALSVGAMDDATRAAATDLSARVEAAVAPLRDPAGSVHSALRLAAVLERTPHIPILAARSLAAGGAYRVRKHLLTALGIVDPLSFSGGAAVLFSLGYADTDELALSDLLYDTSGRIRSARLARPVALGNLSGEQLPRW